jgi:hypothetical protein
MRLDDSRNSLRSRVIERTLTALPVDPLRWRQVMEEELGRLLSDDPLIASPNYGAGFNRATMRHSLYQFVRTASAFCAV